MKTLKIIASAILVLNVLLINVFAQSKDSVDLGRHFYLQTDLYIFGLNNNTVRNSPTNNYHMGFCASIGYDIAPRLRLNLKYIYQNSISKYYAYQFYGQGPNFYNHINYDSSLSQGVSLRAQYFLSDDKKNNPLFLTGGFATRVQTVSNIDIVSNNIWDDSASVPRRVYFFSTAPSYLRVLVGPEIGGGWVLTWGRLSFQTELTFSALYSPFVDRRYREIGINLYNGLVYKF